MVFSLFLLLILVGGVIVVTAISTYNALVSLKNQVDRAWANIDVILKQRFDEIPQLVKILEQFVKYEQSVIQKIMEALGIDAALREAGVEEGDTVSIGDFELEWQE